MNLRLRSATEGEYVAVELSCDTDRIKVGRAGASDFQIESNTVSSEHAEIIKRQNGGYEVVDLGSSNGTFVNGRRIDDSAPIHPGDMISFATENYHLEAAPIPLSERPSINRIPPALTPSPNQVGPIPQRVDLSDLQLPPKRKEEENLEDEVARLKEAQWKKDQDLDGAKKALAEAESDLESIESDKQSLEEQLDSSEKALREAVGNGDVAQAALESEISSLKEAIWNKDSDLQAAQTDLLELSETKKSIESEKGELERELSDLRKAAWEKDRVIKETQDTLSGVVSENEAAQLSNQQLSVELENLKKAAWEKDRIIRETQDTLSGVSTESEAAQLTNQQLQDELALLRKSAWSKDKEIRETQSELSATKSEKDKILRTLNSVKQENRRCQEEIRVGSLERQDLEIRLHEAEALQERLDVEISEILSSAVSLNIGLQTDWKRWINSEKESPTQTNQDFEKVLEESSDSETRLAALGSILQALQTGRDEMRRELDTIERIWDDAGPAVEKALIARRTKLEKKVSKLSSLIKEKKETSAVLSDDIDELHHNLDQQIREAYSLNRDQMGYQLPERMKNMVIATDKEESILAGVIDRVDALNELIHHCRGNIALLGVVNRLRELREGFLVMLADHGVTPFTFDKGTLLTKKNLREIEIVKPMKRSQEKNCMMRLSSPGRVLYTQHPGMLLKSGSQEVVLRKAKVTVVRA